MNCFYAHLVTLKYYRRHLIFQPSVHLIIYEIKHYDIASPFFFLTLFYLRMLNINFWEAVYCYPSDPYLDFETFIKPYRNDIQIIPFCHHHLHSKSVKHTLGSIRWSPWLILMSKRWSPLINFVVRPTPFIQGWLTSNVHFQFRPVCNHLLLRNEVDIIITVEYPLCYIVSYYSACVCVL